MQHPSIGAVGADALFASALQRSDEPTARQVRQAVAAAIRTYGDQGCAERVAQEYGDHPEVAAARMRWARATASEALGGPAPKARARKFAHALAAHSGHAA
jgi:hypothetical protein